MHRANVAWMDVQPGHVLCTGGGSENPNTVAVDFTSSSLMHGTALLFSSLPAFALDCFLVYVHMHWPDSFALRSILDFSKASSNRLSSMHGYIKTLLFTTLMNFDMHCCCRWLRKHGQGSICWQPTVPGSRGHLCSRAADGG